MLSTTSLFLKSSRSELPLFLKWEWLLAQIPHLPFHGVQFCPLIRFAPWRLWTLMFHSVSLCHCELGKEFSSSKSTTCNFLHYFQISGAVDSFSDNQPWWFSILRPLAHYYLVGNIQISSLFYTRTCHSTQILHQSSVFFSSCLPCREFRLVIQASDTASALCSQPWVQPTNIIKYLWVCGRDLSYMCNEHRKWLWPSEARKHI